MAGQETINPRTIHHTSQRRLSVNSSPDAINLTPNGEPTLVYRPNSGIYWVVKHNGVIHNLKFQPGPIRDRKDYVDVSLEIQKDLLVKNNVIVNKKVGIGNSDPGSILDVRGGTGTGFTGAGQLTLSTAEATVVDNDILGVLAFQAPKETGADAILPSAAIWGESEATFDASNNDTALVFATANSETVLATAQERMRIDSSGNVGIGEIAPEGNLHISSLTDATFILEADTENDAGSSEAYNPKIELRQDGNAVNSFLGLAGADGSLYTGSIRNALYLESKHNNPLITNIQFVTGGDYDAPLPGTARMTVTDTGEIGIGTTTPDTKLEVVGSFAANGPSSTFVTMTSGDTSPDVSTGNIFKSHADAVFIDQFDGGVCGQIITIISGGVTRYDVTGSELKGGTTNIVTAAGDVTMWVCESATVWHLLSWMDLSSDLSSGGF